MKVGLILLAVSAFLSIGLWYGNADAQMRAGYPRMFNLRGVIDLSYINYSFDAESDGFKTESEFSLIQQRYSLNLDGYIYHPRLVVFSSGISYIDSKSKNSEEIESQDIGYDFSVTFLPFRPISFDVYASKTDYTLKGYATPMEANTNQYGARLRLINVWKLPATRIEYKHMDYTFLSTSGGQPGFESDRWDVSVQGAVRRIKTSYGFGFGFGDISNPRRSYDSEYVRWNTGTRIKNIATLSTYYRSSEDEGYYTYTNYGALLLFKPYRGFHHEYNYDYYENEYTLYDIFGFPEQITFSSTKHLSGTWSYGFPGWFKGLKGSFTLDRNINEETTQDLWWFETTEERWKSYGYVPRVSYRRHIAGLDLSTHYTLFYRKDERRGNSKEHNFELGIETRKLRWATMYADYAFLKLNATDKFVGRDDEFFFGEEEIKESTYSNMTHSFRTGMRGKGLGALRKSNWNIEAELLYGTSSGERPITDFEGEEVIMKWTRNIWEFTVFADLLYPLHLFGKDLMTSTKIGYTLGKTSWERSAPLFYSPIEESDSRKIQRVYTHNRFNYPISRRLLLQLWRLQMWDKIEGLLDRITTSYNILFLYRIGRVSLSLEYEGLKEEESGRIRDSRRLFIRLRRPFG